MFRGLTYQLMDATTIQGLHSALGCARVIVLDEAVVETLCLKENQ